LSHPRGEIQSISPHHGTRTGEPQTTCAGKVGRNSPSFAPREKEKKFRWGENRDPIMKPLERKLASDCTNHRRRYESLPPEGRRAFFADDRREGPLARRRQRRWRLRLVLSVWRARAEPGRLERATRWAPTSGISAHPRLVCARLRAPAQCCQAARHARQQYDGARLGNDSATSQ
jgi:hypothetical protein